MKRIEIIEAIVKIIEKDHPKYYLIRMTVRHQLRKKASKGEPNTMAIKLMDKVVLTATVMEALTFKASCSAL